MLLILVLSALFIIGLRSVFYRRLTNHPVAMLALGLVFGVVLRALGLPDIDQTVIRDAAGLGLAMLGFLAAQQCRLSRLHAVSAPVMRLALAGGILSVWAFALVAFAMQPAIAIFGALVVASGMILGVAPQNAPALLSAPISDGARRAARLEPAIALAVGLPLAILFEAAVSPVGGVGRIVDDPVFLALGGFAFGGGVGLLAGRYLPLSNAPLPVLPFLVALAVYSFVSLIGFNPVMATVAAGILYNEEAPLTGEVRTRLWRVGESVIAPGTLFLAGALLGPLLFAADLLTWVAAILLATVVRGGVRYVSLRGLQMREQEQGFFVWFGGHAGVGSALFLLYLVGSSAAVIDEAVLSLGMALLVISLLIGQVAAGPLLARLIHSTNRPRRRVVAV